jgi:hypothetical protein
MLCQIVRVIDYESGFHDESINIGFKLLICMSFVYTLVVKHFKSSAQDKPRYTYTMLGEKGILMNSADLLLYPWLHDPSLPMLWY